MRLAVATIAALLLVPAAFATIRAHVRLADASPAMVSGAGFRPGEHVLVHATNGTLVLSKRVRANAAGAFAARFLHDLPTPACGQVAIRAIGDLGDRAAWKTPPRVCGAQPPVDN